MTDRLISVIIPTKNEPLVQQLVNDVHQTLNGIPHEIIVVDHSIKPPNLQDAELIPQQTSGLGKAVIEALPHTHGDLLIIMDGDYSHDPKQLPDIIQASTNYDIVLGSRFVTGGRNLDSSSRNFVSNAYRSIARTVLRLPLTDPMSGFSVAHKTVYKAVKLNPIGYKINLELVYKAKRIGFTVTEIPITFYPRRQGQSKAGVREGLRTLLFIFALRLGLR